MEWVFKDYRITCVYRQLSPVLKAEIIKLWLDHQVLDPVEAERRTAEVLFTVRNPQGELVGVNSVYVMDFLRPNNPYYFYRYFIRPTDRGVFGLRSFIANTARTVLREYAQTAHTLKGIIIVTENIKFMRKGAKRQFERNGWRYFGRGPRGFDIWYENFDGSILTNGESRP